MTKEQTLSHIAVIMDGNGRWAKSQNLPTSAGHKQGAERAKEIVEESINQGIRHLTLYTFSSENWNRSEKEINDIFNLLRYYLDNSIHELMQNGVQLKFIGDISLFPIDIQEKCSSAENKKPEKELILVNIALNYGGKQEIVMATRKIIENGENVSLENIEKNLYTSQSPNPDLLIRTGGEKRLSNFLLWQSAYSELYFSDKFWPEFTKNDFCLAIEEFHKRERRFGAR